jgi:hypothetical protein
MQGISLAINKLICKLRQVGLAIALLLSVTSCTSRSTEAVRTIQIYQDWELTPGDAIAGHLVLGGLGDISVELKGDSVYAPFNGRVQPNVKGCVIFSTPEIPAYLFRLCGLKRPALGQVSQGQAIGSGDYLQFAALRRQPDGRWALVEPGVDILERTLEKP